MAVKRADIVVGIPSYNEADNISFVVEQASKGLEKYFSDFKSVIVNVDNHSEDGTKQAFLGSNSEVPLKYISTHKGVTGKGNNFHNFFDYVLKVGAKAAFVVDADLKSITPEWVKKMCTPVLEGCDFVVPVYTRHKYDATITNNICYPLIYGLVGKNVRQPIAGDFAFSKSLCRYYLSRKWNNTTYQYGIDIFMTLNAIFGGFKVTQVCLGSKVHKPSAPKLGKMFVQVVYTLFSELLKNRKKWWNTKSVDNLGFTGKERLGKGQDLKIDDIIIKRTALVDYKQHRKIIKHYLTPSVFAEVDQSFLKGRIVVKPELWTRIVYDLLYMFSKGNNHLAVIKAMKSLYFGRFYTFMHQTRGWSNLEAEKEFRKQAEIFRDLKPYLLVKFKG